MITQTRFWDSYRAAARARGYAVEPFARVVFDGDGDAFVQTGDRSSRDFVRVYFADAEPHLAEITSSDLSLVMTGIKTA